MAETAALVYGLAVSAAVGALAYEPAAQRLMTASDYAVRPKISFPTYGIKAFGVRTVPSAC